MKMNEECDERSYAPEGNDFLTLTWDQEDECSEHTQKMLPTMGEKAPQCQNNLGTILSLLDRAASCFWECKEGDHVIEYLAGRVSSSARGSLRLLNFGFYDESLSLTRGIGEIANLLFLFMTDSMSFDAWRNSSRSERLRDFSPHKVRVQLEKLKIPVPINQARYRQLCEIAAHVTPETKPQSHNPIGLPTLGGYFQIGGVLLAINELALATSYAAIPLPKLLKLDRKYGKLLIDASRNLLFSIGSIDVISRQEVWEELSKKAKEL